MTLGGAIFVHNAIQYDYCIKESIYSLCDVCDEVVVLEAESNDGTAEFLAQIDMPNVRIVSGKWECEAKGEPGYSRLRNLANKAKSYLKTDWWFMLQADEILHESSIETIRKIIEDDRYNAYTCRRINLYKDFEHYVKFDSNRKPCADLVVRLARIDNNATGDAENISADRGSTEHVSNITIFHYGFVRDRRVMLDKIIDMETWFGIGIDKKAVKQKAETGVFNYKDFMPDSELDILKQSHPEKAIPWIRKRENEELHLKMFLKKDTEEGYNSEDFEDSYWINSSRRNSPRMLRRNPNLVNYFKDLMKVTGLPGKVLDIGAGGGNAVSDLREAGIEADGCEFSESGRRLCKEQYDIDLFPCDLRIKLPFEDSQYDWGLCIGVLSMIPKKYMKNALSELLRVVKYGVLINVTTVVGDSIWSNQYHITAMDTPEYWQMMNELGGYDWTSLLPPQRNKYGIGVGGEFAGLWSKNTFSKN